MSFKPIRFHILLCMLFIPLFSGCESMGYYTQVLSGQMSIVKKRKPIDRLLIDAKTSENLKNKLESILEIRKFAENELCLPAGEHYLTFVELDRPFVLWNVYAAPEFSLAPKEWCFPVVGCTAYRGYFSKQDADEYAGKLRRKGYDVYVGGVAAYSTLGWFDDPVLNTFIHYSDIELAALVFHELAHQRLYVADDSTFNESFATTVEQEGVRRWLSAKNNPAAFSAYQIDYHRQEQFVQLVMKYRSRLEKLFAGDLPMPDKRDAKAEEFNNLREEYGRLKQQWKGYSGYDGWFDHELNNAKLVTVSTYYDLVPVLLKLLDAGGGNFEVFYKKCEELAKKSKGERLAALHSSE